MFAFLLTLLILDGILLMVVILLQSGKGGGLAAMGGGGGMGGGDSLIGGRQAAGILTKTSWIGGGVFLALALILSVMSSRSGQPDSILREEFQQTAPTTAPQPVLPGLQPEGDGAGAAEPQVPGTEPAGTDPTGDVPGTEPNGQP